MRIERSFLDYRWSIVAAYVAIFLFASLAAATTPSPSPTPKVIEDANLDAEVEKDSGTEINVKNADIGAIIRLFSKKAKRNYILDENVKGKVSIFLPGKVSPDEALRVLDAVLALKGFTSVPIGENLWKVVPSKEAKQTTIPTVVGDTDHIATAAVITRLINLKYVAAEDLKQLLTPLVSAEGLLNAYTGTNSLIIIDSEDNIERLIKLIDALDVPYTNAEMTIIPVKNADAADIAAKLSDILGTAKDDSQRGGTSGSPVLDAIRARMGENVSGSTGGQQGTPSNMNTVVRGGGAQGASGTTVGSRARDPKIIPDERTNSIIVVADDDTTARIRALVSQLDSELDLSGFRFYVYRCQYANANDLANVLSGLTGSGGSGRTSSTSDLFGGNDSLASAHAGLGIGGGSSSSRSGRSGSSTQNRNSNQRRTPGQSRTNPSSNQKSGSVNLGENISITADPSTNSLIIFASKQDYLKMKALLEDLDVKRRQVLVEAILLEVGIDSSTKVSTEFLTSAGGKDGGILAKSDFTNNLSTLFSDPKSLSDFSVAAASAGTLTLPGGITIPTQTILLDALQTNTNVNVLSAPTILATDNEQAEIVVGQNVPFLASKSTSDTNLNNTFNQIDRQDVGITLRLTPQISSGEAVSLQIFTEVSNVVEATASSELGPTTTIRTSETSVVTKDGQMVVIGGLMSDNTSQAESGIPFLKDVPVLGHLFRSSAENGRRTNLLIFITPRIIQDQYDMRDTSLDERDKLKAEFEARDVYPRRDEVLENPRLDKVTGISKLPFEKPGTILPPERRSSGESEIETKNNLSIDRIETPSVMKKDPIELRVVPKFESSKTLQTKVKYVVLKVSDPKNIPSNLPFPVDKKHPIFGIIVPEGSTKEALEFFSTGGVYSYGGDNKKIVVSVLDSLDTPGTLQKKFLLSGSWYTLSPHEVMNIGSGPWVKE